MELGEHLGDHGQRRDRQCGGEEQREHRPLGVVAQQRRRGEEPATEAEGERHEEAAGRDQDGSFPQPADQRQVGLEAGDDEQHDHAEPTDGEQHARLHHSGREHPVEEARSHTAEDRWAEDDSRRELPHHGRLPDPPAQLAEQPGDDEQQRDLHEEHQDLVFAGLHETQRRLLG